MKKMPPKYLGIVRGMPRFILVILASVLCSHCVCADPLKVAVLNDGPAVSDIQKLYQQAGYAVALDSEADLANLKAPETALLVIPPKSVFPPNARRGLNRYLAEGGNVADLSPQAFNYDPKPVDPKPIVDFGKEGGYTVTKPESGAYTVINLPGGKSKGIHLASKYVYDGELFVSIPLEAHRSADRSVVCFDAKGDYDIDALRLTLEDDSAAKYVAFVELGRDWRRYTLSFADFVRVGEEKNPAPVEPAKVRLLTLGVHYKVVWKDVRGSFSLGQVSLAKASRFAGVPTSYIMKWRNRYARSGAPFPDWIIDPFQLPQHFRGTEDMEIGDALKVTDMRRAPIPLAKSSGRQVTASEIRTFTGGPYAKSSLILFSIEGGDYAPGKPLAKALISASDLVTRTCRIAKVTPITTPADEKPTQLRCKVSVLNPLSTSVSGRVTVTVADGLMHGSETARLKPGGFTDVTVNLGEAPQAFPMTRFKWRAEVEAGGRHDALADTVDVERSLIQAAIYMMNVQKGHPDGRFSIYFFTDIYTARTLFALSNYLRAPAVWERNADLLAGLKPHDFAESAFRFCDMVVSRQTAEGGISIGYAERDNLLFTADDGTIVLGLLQIASQMGDDARAKRYTEAGRKYFKFRESLYISAEKSKRLQEQFGKDAPGTREGLYGLGLLNSDMLKKNGEHWPEPKIEERGIQWVMPISMGAVAALDLMNPSSPEYHPVVLRDAAEIINQDYGIGRSSYFHVECLFWMRQAITDPDIRAKLLTKIEQFIPQVLGADDTPYYFQGRGALHWLNLAYYRQIEDSARTRAPMAQGVWQLCSESSGGSLKGIADRFPSTAYGPSCGGYRTVAYGSIALMELLKPGSTRLQKR